MAPAINHAPRWRVFTRLWGIALVSHVVGNWALAHLPAPVAWVNLAIGMLGITLAIRPQDRLLLLASGLVVGSVLLETPVLGNHWLLAGIISLALLVSQARPDDFFPAARLILLVFYAFAAFAKLNSGFFDPSVSCAVFYANQWLDGLLLSPLPSDSPAASGAVWGSAAIELAVPILLVWRLSRPLGVVLGTAFHTLISYDLNQHFYDFTAVLVALFFLFVSERSAARLDALFVEPLPRPKVFSAAFVAIGLLMVVSAVTPLRNLTVPFVTIVPFVLWIPFSFWWLVTLIKSQTAGESLIWKARPMFVALAVATVLNGLTPYLEVKTAFSFNMYSNLETAGGKTNHFVVGRTLPLREGYIRPVQIVATNDDGLQEYLRRGYLIAFPEFRKYLASRPETSVTYLRGESLYQVDRAGDHAFFSAPGEWWMRFLPLRSLDATSPSRCQDVFLGAM